MSSKDGDEKKNKQKGKLEKKCDRIESLELVKKSKRIIATLKDKAALKVEEKEQTEQLRAERMKLKGTSKSETKKLPLFTVRRKSTRTAYNDEDIEDPTVYYPHKGVRRSIIEDITKGGSRRATEPLKTQLLKIIGKLPPESKFIQERNPAILKIGQSSNPKRPERAQTCKDLKRSAMDSLSTTPQSPNRFSTAQYNDLKPQAISGSPQDELVEEHAASNEPVLRY